MQDVAGTNKIGGTYIGEYVHDLAMSTGSNHPDENRDRLKTTNDMWKYPETLGPGAITAHIPPPSVGKDDAVEVDSSKLAVAAKKTAAAAKTAAGDAKAAPSLAQKKEINSDNIKPPRL